jgi:hypothetical protein
MITFKSTSPFLALTATLLVVPNLAAELQLAPVFSSSMVLQQGMALPIWGCGDCGETVTVEFHGQRVPAIATNGKWSLKLAELPSSSSPETLTVIGARQRLQLTNVLVGDVWLCSGQSNMEMPLGASFQSEDDVAAATNTLIRLLRVQKSRAKTPQTAIGALWEVCSPETVWSFSAIAYDEKIECSGPIYRSMSADGDKIILHFDHVGAGLEARGGELKGFAICGTDQKFVWASSKIVGNTVVVSSQEVLHPVAVRYGWTDYPMVNLWSKDGLPASPFRTDDFEN